MTKTIVMKNILGVMGYCEFCDHYLSEKVVDMKGTHYDLCDTCAEGVEKSGAGKILGSVHDKKQPS